MGYNLEKTLAIEFDMNVDEENEEYTQFHV